MPEFTFIYRADCSAQDTVAQLVQEFCSAYRRKFDTQFNCADLQLVSDKGRTPRAAELVIKVFESGADVQVTNSRKVPGEPQESTSRIASAHQVDSSIAGDQSLDVLAADLQHSSADDRAHAENSKRASPTDELLNSKDKVYLPIIRQFLDRAKEAESKKYFRAACKIYEQVNCRLAQVGRVPVQVRAKALDACSSRGSCCCRC